MSFSGRSLLGGYTDSYDQIVQNHAICNALYFDPLIPRYDRDAVYLVILSSLELTLVLFLWLVLCLKKYYILVLKNNQKAKAILLPYYDRIVYYYSFITIFRMIFAIFKYLMYTIWDFDLIDHLWYIALIEGVSALSLISIELFIVLLISQTSVGHNAFIRATKGTMLICTIIGIIILFKSTFGSNVLRFKIWLIFSVLIHGLLLCIYVFIFCYVYIYHENVKKMKRKRNKILYSYLSVIVTIHSIFTMSYLFEMCKIDAFCFVIIGEYLYRIIFPVIAYITIKNDSKFWKNIIYSLQFVRSPSITKTQQTLEMHNIHQSEDELLSGVNYRNSIRSIFGDNISAKSGYDPIVNALELEINIIRYDDLYDLSDPFAMGTTAMIHKATYKGETVAVKKWIFDEIDLSLAIITDFFQETLFSNIIHPNLVQFKGACLRPPELCLVYEYVNCGDLAHLILQNGHERYDNVIQIRNRLDILMGIAAGMNKLHQEDIIHRDIKTSNVLVKYHQQSDKYVAKICDFGSCRKLKNINKSTTMDSIATNAESVWNNNIRMTTQVGTIAFMAPELLRKIDIKKLLSVSFNDGTNSNHSNVISNDYELMTETTDGDERGLVDRKWSANSQNILTSLSNKLKANKEDDTLSDHHATNSFSFNDGSTSFYDKSVDIFAFGIMMYEIGFLLRIYESMDLIEIYEIITNNERMPILSYQQCQNPQLNPRNGFYAVSEAIYESYVNLMKQCWSQNPNNRPTFTEIKIILQDVATQT